MPAQMHDRLELGQLLNLDEQVEVVAQQAIREHLATVSIEARVEAREVAVSVSIISKHGESPRPAVPDVVHARLTVLPRSLSRHILKYIDVCGKSGASGVTRRGWREPVDALPSWSATGWVEVRAQGWNLNWLG